MDTGLQCAYVALLHLEARLLLEEGMAYCACWGWQDSRFGHVSHVD